MGGIQTESAFPGDPSSARQTANMTSPLQENLHLVRSRASNGLSFHSRAESRPYVYIICDDGSSWPFKKWNYPPATLSNPSSQRFGDASGFIRNEQGADRQFDWFVPNKASGSTQAGLSRLNQSIEAPVYCALGAQVNVQSSILGDGGRAKEAQSEFLASLEDSTRQPDLSKSVSAGYRRRKVAPWFGSGAQSVADALSHGDQHRENSCLQQQAQAGNTEHEARVNQWCKQRDTTVGLRLMDSRRLVLTHQSAHPSNPIHKAAIKSQGLESLLPTRPPAPYPRQRSQVTT